jgi:hypothetical protein
VAAGCCEHGNEPSGSIQGGECLDPLSNCQLLKKDRVHGASNYIIIFLEDPIRIVTLCRH